MNYLSLVTSKILAHFSNYRNAKRTKKDIKYIVVHYTANDGDSDEGNAQYFQSPNRNASAHFFVDDESITQTVELEDIAWHCGGSVYNDVKTTGGAKYHNICTNTNSIGIEMCDTVRDGKYNLSKKTRNNTIKLVRALMKDFDIDIDHVIRHFDVTGKYCPRYFCPPYGSNDEWNKFKLEIINNTETSEKKEETVVENKPTKSYKVRVTVDALNYRKGPGTNYKINGVIYDRGVYTIVDEKNGWGKLKSGAGWISLYYTKKL